MALAEELSRDVNPGNANTQVALEKAIGVTSLPAVPPSLTLAGIAFAIFPCFSGSVGQPMPGQGWKESHVEDGRNWSMHTVARFSLGHHRWATYLPYVAKAGV